MSIRPHVLIAGAGLRGLAAANALLAKGIDVDVYEQAAALGEVGAGVQISPNGAHVLAALGLLDEPAASLRSRPGVAHAPRRACHDG